MHVKINSNNPYKDNFQNDYSDNNSFQNEQIQAPNENI